MRAMRRQANICRRCKSLEMYGALPVCVLTLTDDQIKATRKITDEFAHYEKSLTEMIEMRPVPHACVNVEYWKLKRLREL